MKSFSCIALLALTLGIPDAALAQTGEDQALRRGRFTHDGYRLSYWEMGEGEVLLLLHGLFGSGDVWSEVAPLQDLAREWRVVAMDLRGHGASSAPHDPQAYGRHMSVDVIGLLDHLGVARAHVLGYSFGGLVAGRLLVEAPERLSSLILGGASRIRPDHPEDVQWAHSMADRLDAGDGAQWLADALSSGDAARDSAQRALIEQRVADADLAASAAVLRSVASLTVPDSTITSSPVPLLGLVGELDPSRAEVRAMFGMARDGRVTVISGADHAAAPRDPLFWEAVQQWLRGFDERGPRSRDHQPPSSSTSK